MEAAVFRVHKLPIRLTKIALELRFVLQMFGGDLAWGILGRPSIPSCSLQLPPI